MPSSAKALRAASITCWLICSSRTSLSREATAEAPVAASARETVSHHISIYQRLVAHLTDNQYEHDGDIDGGEAKGCGPFG